MTRARCTLFLTMLVACLAWAGPAQAFTYTVNSTSDLGDATRGDHVCASDGQGCTLRAAVEEAGSDDNFLDNTIVVPPGTYDVSTPLQPVFTTHIRGSSPRTTIIRRNASAGSIRVFEIDNSTVDISGVTIRDGIADANNGFFGGNIRAQGSTVTIVNSMIANGSGSSGGGISNVIGDLAVINSTITGNHADTGGGDGGGIQNAGNADIASNLVIQNSTISGNTARLAAGIISGSNAGNTVIVQAATIANNDSSDRLDLPNGGGMSILDGTATVRASIVANNTSPAPTTPNCASEPGGSPPGTISSAGDNLESGTDCGFNASGDLQSRNPQLGALANNGGLTDTRALPASSPAVDQIPAGSANCSPADQRGVPRPLGAGCDIGAFELSVAPDTTIDTSPPAITEDRTPTFTFSSAQPGTTFECSLNNAPFTACTSPLTLPELPAGTHTLEIRARDAAGNVDPTPAFFTFVIPAKLSDLDPPKLGKTVNAEPVSGTVLVGIPGGAGASRRGGAHAAQKGIKFIPLQEAKQVPIGAFFNTKKGKVRLQTATSKKGKRQSADFNGGLFQTVQSGKKSAKGVFELRLKGSSFKGCGSTKKKKSKKASISRRSKRKIRRLRGSGKGRFRTRGRYSSATVRGTIWTVTDRCDGTLTQVKRGKVTVRDFRKKKNKLVKAGKSYLAKAPG